MEIPGSGKRVHEVLGEYNIEGEAQRDRGTRFERAVVSLFRRNALYKNRFEEVWMWGDWPGREGKPDTGIDVVAKEADSEGYCAIQCKYVSEKYVVQKADIDSFFTASGKHPFTSRIIVTTSNNWSKHAEDALDNQQIPVSLITLNDLDDGSIDWSEILPARTKVAGPKEKSSVRPHQRKAIDAIKKGFETGDRGKLIMACGTGKTYTSLKLMEEIVPEGGLVLFLVPSIALLSQALREWTAQAEIPLRCYAVCSDSTVGKRTDTEDIRVHDLAIPASTNKENLLKHFEVAKRNPKTTILFSTYQSIKVVSEAQREGLPDFDLVICDEAHRTTGVTIAGEDESAFVRIHDNEFVKAKKRLYMTATPRIYADSAKSKAKEIEGTLCSMDDEQLYGPEFHRLGFGEAVEDKLLTDYKVLVLVVSTDYVSVAVQNQMAANGSELQLEDTVKVIGCWNGLSKKFADEIGSPDPEIKKSFMGRAVAFTRSIADSKKISTWFEETVEEAKKGATNTEKLLNCEGKHVDGTMSVLKRNELLDWLKEEHGDPNVCRILSNARCLSEGVDVPALDAVLFLNPRDSIVDVVQSVGRVMRKSPGKDFGYVILPIGVPAGIDPAKALDDNKNYRVVWQVLQALRAHDDRFAAFVNKLDFNKQQDQRIQVIGVGGGKEEVEGDHEPRKQPSQLTLPEIEEWRTAIYAKVVDKCGERDYWQKWARRVGEISQIFKSRIRGLVDKADDRHDKAFKEFVAELRQSINPSVTEAAAIDMLSQHMVTKPIFDSLFEGHQFTENNPVSIAMQLMIESLEGQHLEVETQELEKMYERVAQRAAGITNSEGRQKIITELYEKFFSEAFPKLKESLGIVFTPIEVVDFIIQSADFALKNEFGVGLKDEGVHILDPFTGTGTFIVRLLESGLIPPEYLPNKYHRELHANEIVLLAYYIAAVNIERAYHDAVGGEYKPFDGIVLADTFQLTEGEGSAAEMLFEENSERAKAQNKCDIRVIVGNPPYSIGQESENDGNKNLKYKGLDARIAGTFANATTATNKNSLYDSYIRAIRWATDRIKEDGIICYVTNGSFIDSNSSDGLRKCLAEEFSSVYCFNLRGNARTQGESRRAESGNVFGGGSRAPVAITLLIKNSKHDGPCEIRYYDIGDYLTRENKLAIISQFGSVAMVPWVGIEPNSSGDWINHRDESFGKFPGLGSKGDSEAVGLFSYYSNGLKTQRDAWTYNFSHLALADNMARMAAFYNQQLEDFQNYCRTAAANPSQELVEKFINTDPKKISWSRALKNDLRLLKQREFEPEAIRIGSYRPFCKEWVYFSRAFNDMVYQMPRIFPTPQTENVVIGVSGLGGNQASTALITNVIPDLNRLHSGSQNFPLYIYEPDTNPNSSLYEPPAPSGYKRRDAITDEGLKLFTDHYRDSKIGKEDLFYYIYGILHSPEYKTRFAADLKKMLPRIPFAADFWAFSRAGRELAHWHLNYETIEPYPLEEITSGDVNNPRLYRIEKMRFGKQNKAEDRGTIVYNSHLSLSGIPLEAYDYVVNGRPAIEWVMERYQVKTEKESQILNDPNLYDPPKRISSGGWAENPPNPRYIVDLLKRIVRVSLESVRIVNSLPPQNESK